MMRSKIFWSVLAACLAVTTVYSVRFFRIHGPAAGLVSSARAAGSPNGDLRILELVDYQCGACQKADETLQDYLRRYPARIYLETQAYPLDAHPHGLRSAVYAECAARQKKFREFHNLLFLKQKEWAVMPDIESRVHEYAASAGLDPVKLDACLADPAVRDAVIAEKKKNESLGVRSTPTFFLNGKMAVGLPAFREAADAYLANPSSDSGSGGSDAPVAVYR